MVPEGAYPFIVYVRNFFPKGGPGIKVQHYFCPYYEYPDKIQKIQENNENNGNGNQDLKENEYCIKAGEVVCFPLFWNDEWLKISLDPVNLDKNYVSSSNGHYFIWAGPKAKCYFDPVDKSEKVKNEVDKSNIDKFEFTPSPFGKGKDTKNQDITQSHQEATDGREYYRGGTWKVNNPDFTSLASSDYSWSLEIRKYSPDPEEDDVTVGEERPG